MILSRLLRRRKLRSRRLSSGLSSLEVVRIRVGVGHPGRRGGRRRKGGRGGEGGRLEEEVMEVARLMRELFSEQEGRNKVEFRKRLRLGICSRKAGKGRRGAFGGWREGGRRKQGRGKGMGLCEKRASKRRAWRPFRSVFLEVIVDTMSLAAVAGFSHSALIKLSDKVVNSSTIASQLQTIITSPSSLPSSSPSLSPWTPPPQLQHQQQVPLQQVPPLFQLLLLLLERNPRCTVVSSQRKETSSLSSSPSLSSSSPLSFLLR